MATRDKDVFIDAPQLLTQQRRITDTLITAIMWVLYSYLWAPFISLLAWLLGIEFAYDVMVRAGGAQGLVDILIFYGIVLANIFLVVAAWSGINRYRFADQERRTSVTDTTDAKIAEHFSLLPGDLAKMRNLRIASVAINPGGGVEKIKDVEKENG